MLGDESGSLLALVPGEPVPEAAEAFHFGFEVDGREAVAAARERLRAAGVRELEWEDDGRMAVVKVADPDGYCVEVFG
jgi:catechol 2,3-dioxygenase-like lactoylglutathione lyase family enzyme